MKEYKYNPTRFIRFINKHTKDFVDIPFVGGTRPRDRREMARLAPRYAGWSMFSDKKEKPKFHFFVLWSKGDEANNVGGIYYDKPSKDKPSIFTFSVDLDNNEINKSKDFVDGLETLKLSYDDFFKLLEIKNMS